MMSPEREQIVRTLFTSLDSSGSGSLDVSDVKQRFQASKHPDVVKGRKLEEDVLYEFLDTFETHFESVVDRKIRVDQFIEYFNLVSGCIDNDA
jgi:hypothetical protein